MDLSEIIKDAITYPTKNITALVIYLVLGFLVGLVLVFTGIGSFATGSFSFGAGVVIGIVGIIVVICLYLLMSGFSLDVIKFAINRRDDAPSIDFGNQVSNGFKYLIVSFVYLIIPIIIGVVLGFFVNQWLGVIVGLILFIIFMLGLTMAECRLAQTSELGHALDIGGAISDISKIGLGKVIITIIAALIVGMICIFILNFIVGLILGIIGSETITSTIVPIWTTVIDAWFLFYMNRVMGLLYSDIA